ncbi:hypothetical protein QBC43DRAFT_302876 [Cladorrhinum sp. PSN259]|nr:hypothetical protein QBC43DRAFT_302876 [Cladorrhinum sp. PSN259]
MGYEWHGNPTTTVVIIAVTCCFGWMPIVIAVSIVGKIRAKYGKTKSDVENKPAGWHPKQPKLETPSPIYHSTGSILERTLSNRTLNPEAKYDLKRWESHSSWDPVKPFEYNDNESVHGIARPNSIRSNYTARSRALQPPTTGTPSRSSSIRSVASQRSHQDPPGRHLAHAPPRPQQSRTSSRRGSVSSNYDGPPVAFQINDAYYDTTPLPEMPVLPAAPKLAVHIREPSSNSRPTSSNGSGSGSGSGAAAEGPRGTWREKPSAAPREGHREAPKSAMAKGGGAAGGGGRQDDGLRRHRSKQSISDAKGADRVAPPRRGSLHSQTSNTPKEDWFDQPHAM